MPVKAIVSSQKDVGKTIKSYIYFNIYQDLKRGLLGNLVLIKFNIPLSYSCLPYQEKRRSP